MEKITSKEFDKLLFKTLDKNCYLSFFTDYFDKTISFWIEIGRIWNAEKGEYNYYIFHEKSNDNTFGKGEGGATLLTKKEFKKIITKAIDVKKLLKGVNENV